MLGRCDGAPAGRNACRCAACSPRDRETGDRARPRWIARRTFVALGIGAGVSGASGLLATEAAAQTKISPDAALDQLMAGNRRYVGGAMASFTEDLALLKSRTVEKQEPFGAVLSCADSRVPVEIVFDQSIGRLFVARVAGNIATPEIIGTLEYGAAVLGTRVIMVLAHQGCGAVKAAVGGQAAPGQISALYAGLNSAVQRGDHDYDATAKRNAKIQADLLRSASPVLAELSSKGGLKVVAAYYSLETGTVTLL
jgi:carbonic anhydrase